VAAVERRDLRGEVRDDGIEGRVRRDRGSSRATARVRDPPATSSELVAARRGPAVAPAARWWCANRRARRRAGAGRCAAIGHSVWLRNSVCGGGGLGIAVAVAALTDVQHAFWVVRATLCVLRSSALRTEQPRH
jgi:hypothetical protein